MSIFSRFKDIISSNINNMLDNAEDPEKLIRLMLREMEETLGDLKAGCAATMAEGSKLRRAHQNILDQIAQWDKRAELALRAEREDMAREALEEKVALLAQSENLEREAAGFDDLVAKSREDIRLLEERIQNTKDRQRLLVERHKRANTRKQAREQMQAADNSTALRRFDDLEQRVERMENEADLAWTQGDKQADFRQLEHQHAVNEELDALRKRLQD